jgi:hypothetical protein
LGVLKKEDLMSRKYLYIVCAAFVTAAALAFGCSDSGTVGEPPDVSGSYTVKASTCPFAGVGNAFSVVQGATDKRQLSISLSNSAAMLDTSAMVGGPAVENVAPPSADDNKNIWKGASISNAIAGASGTGPANASISLDVNVSEADEYACTGNVEIKDNIKVANLKCLGNSGSCDIVAQTSKASANQAPAEPATTDTSTTNASPTTTGEIPVEAISPEEQQVNEPPETPEVQPPPPTAQYGTLGAKCRTVKAQAKACDQGLICNKISNICEIEKQACNPNLKNYGCPKDYICKRGYCVNK